MNEIDLTDILNKIISFSSFTDVFIKLNKIDKKKTGEIENSLKQCVKDIHKGIVDSQKENDKLKYLLLKESIEIKAHLSSYLSYSETMAIRENALWKFTVTLTEQFFDIISDALDEYFKAKIKIMDCELDKDSKWYTGIRDSSKKLGVVINYPKRLLKKGMDKIGLKEFLDDNEMINTQSIVEQSLVLHLSPEQVSKDISQIMEEANNKYKERWENEIKIQSPDLNQLKTFASSYGENIDINIGFELGAAEQTFAVGIASAVAGSIGLAVGWHTLTYAMLNVFPPIATFAVLGTIVVAIFTKEKTLENRKKQIREAVKQYHRYFLLQIETEKLKELNNKTIREAMIEQSKNIINDTTSQWSKAISGNLTVEHYRMLIPAFTKHLILINEAIQKLGE